MTPNERTVRYLVERGVVANRVDRNLGRFITVDWPGHGVGFADVMAISPDYGAVNRGVTLIQATTPPNKAAHVVKLRGAAHVIRRCQAAGVYVELWLWPPEDESDEPQRIPVNEDMLNVLAAV